MPVSEPTSFTDNGLPGAEIALYLYEYVITFDQEIKHIWAKKWSLSTLIFVLNRYINFAFTRMGLLSPSTYTVRTTLLIFVWMTYMDAAASAQFLEQSNFVELTSHSWLRVKESRRLLLDRSSVPSQPVLSPEGTRSVQLQARWRCIAPLAAAWVHTLTASRSKHQH